MSQTPPIQRDFASNSQRSNQNDSVASAVLSWNHLSSVEPIADTDVLNRKRAFQARRTRSCTSSSWTNPALGTGPGHFPIESSRW
ncbi:hypothetical protein RISK_001596 [Rhodopirellula islandica]|uniref:Uncharacterized protein n=1 Tax=Rhodopirellula islandica TaxID=595434 RepID=A0A0J1BIM7_RHOIS|nr:hypothetical protein RISK_001596 [Rhodopirellula islandica]